MSNPLAQVIFFLIIILCIFYAAQYLCKKVMNPNNYDKIIYSGDGSGTGGSNYINRQQK